ncbi:MAG: E2 protein [Lutjanus campechanus-associated papillomavirus 1]|uniref:Protein E8^E2C n=1 Tax=Lutjanus campechanus-associated papillomavirus 1 TaxID=2683335 RepID=A0A8M0HI06_9PAPI|nr:MAG: E2 protein [Lutjanus campechanus-associated papillomavirus 1]
MSLNDLIELEQKQFKGRKKVKSLSSGLEQLFREALYVNHALMYRATNNTPTHLLQLVSNGKALQLQSQTVLEHLKKALEEFIPVVQDLLESKVASGIFSYHDLQPVAYNSAPIKTIKQGGHYTANGYPTYNFIYMKDTEWIKIKPQSDAKGFFWLDKTKKIYYFKHSVSTDKPPKRPVKGGRAKTKKCKKTTPPPAAAEVVSHPLEGKTLLPKKGHGLSRLLAEAKDPPGIEISGRYEVVKGHRRRLLQSQHKFKDISPLFKWKSGTVAFIILFDSETKREEFLESGSTTSHIKLRLCSFY